MKLSEKFFLTLSLQIIILISLAYSRRLNLRSHSLRMKKTLKKNSANPSTLFHFRNLGNMELISIYNEMFYNGNYPDSKKLVQLIYQVRKMVKEQKNIQEINMEKGQGAIIVADLNGQFIDLRKIIKLGEHPNESNYYIFLGDYIELGPDCLRTIVLLLCFKLLNPDYVFLARGNLETLTVVKQSFVSEVISQYEDGSQIALLFYDFFNCLPLGFIVNKNTLMVNGGIPVLKEFNEAAGAIKKINEEVNRFESFLDNKVIQEILLNEASLNGINEIPEDERDLPRTNDGIGFLFSEVFAKKFLEKNGLKRLITGNGLHKDQNNQLESLQAFPDQMVVKFSSNTGPYDARRKGVILIMEVESKDKLNFRPYYFEVDNDL